MPKQIWDFLYENWKAVVIFGLITIGGVIFLASKQLGFTVATTITEKNVEIGNMTYDKYDGTKLEGSDVINAIKRHQKQLPVTVYTGESVDTYKGSFMAAGNDRKSEKYIKPSQVYYGSLQQDKNKEVIGLVFAKEGVQLKDPSYKEEIGNIVGGDAENSTMEELIKKLADAVNGKDAALADLKKKLDALNSSMGNLQTEKTTLTNQINSLTSQLENEKKKYNNLNSEVSSGKSLIANAITKKGVETSATEAFLVMANNIGNLTSGMNYVQGSIQGKYESGWGYTSTYKFVVTDLSFKPSMIFGIVNNSYSSHIFAIDENGSMTIKNSNAGNAGTSIKFTESGFELYAYGDYSQVPYKFTYYAFE